MKEKIIWYLCDGEKEDCKKRRCYKNTKENPCRHTKDINHAVNFKKKKYMAHVKFTENPTVMKTTQPEQILRNEFCKKIHNIF